MRSRWNRRAILREVQRQRAAHFVRDVRTGFEVRRKRVHVRVTHQSMNEAAKLEVRHRDNFQSEGLGRQGLDPSELSALPLKVYPT